MDHRIRAAFTKAVLLEALGRYGINPADTKELDGFENFIFEVRKGSREYVIRLAHSLRRSPKMVMAEVEWINYLSDGGVSVARAVPSPQGHLVEQIILEDGHVFSAAMFDKAPGGRAIKGIWTPELFVQMGRMTGRMHALTKTYHPADPKHTRANWEADVDGFAEKYLPDHETVIINKARELHQYLRALPQDNDSYGLIHFDFHRGNFFVHDGRITLFDFDDCQYNWFAADIAIALFYAIPMHPDTPEDRAVATLFLQRFLEGYRMENRLDPWWLTQIPYFLKAREIDLYVAIHRSMDLDHLDSWCASYMNNRKYKIENDIPFVDLDFGSFA